MNVLDVEKMIGLTAMEIVCKSAMKALGCKSYQELKNMCENLIVVINHIQKNRKTL